MATITGKASELITFSRTSNATLTDSDGKIKWAPHNLLLASEQFDAASWTKSNCTVAANNTVAPNATTTADRILAQSGISAKSISITISLPTGANTFAVFAKKDTQDFIQLVNNGDSEAFVNFNLSTGTVGTAGTKTTGVITPIGSTGWYLCSATFAGSTTYGTDFRVYLVSSASAAYGSALNAAGTEAVYLWGAHLYRSDLGGMKANTSAYPMYNPTTAKNLLGFTQDFSNAAWVAASSGGGAVGVKTPNFGIAPDGTQTATRIQLDVTSASVNGQSQIYQSFVSVTNTVYTRSAWVKTNDGSTKTIMGFQAAGSTPSTLTVTGEWTRLSSVRTASATNDFLQFLLVKGTTSDTADLLVWRPQASDSASLDAYVPNYGAVPTAAAYYGPRLDYDPVTLAAKGLLVEESRVNRIRYSRTLETTGSYWGNLASGTANTLTIDNAPGPDGLSTSASLITYNTAVTGAGTYSAWRHSLSTTANGTYTFSIWLKAGTNTSVYIRLNDSGGNRANTLCTLTSSWQRFTVTGTTTASITSITCDIGADGNAGGQTMTAGTVYAYGAQLEAGSFATSYIPNGDAIAGANRDFDRPSVSAQAFPYSSTEGTLVAAYSLLAVSGTQYLTSLGVDGNSQIYMIGNNGAGSRDAVVITSGTGQGFNAIAGAVASSTVKQGFAFATNSTAHVVNGGSPVTDATVTMPSAANALYLGTTISGFNVTNGHIRQITYLPRRISDTELQTRTA